MTRSKRYRTTAPRRGGHSPPTMLYCRYRDMRSRCNGRATTKPELYQHVESAWASFDEFRRWAIGAGFSKERCSLDRIDPAEGYTPDNCRWITIQEHRRKTLPQFQRGHDDARGPEPGGGYYDQPF